MNIKMDLIEKPIIWLQGGREKDGIYKNFSRGWVSMGICVCTPTICADF
jgi:hypothetical protein